MLQKETIEFIVPVYNESECIDEFMQRFFALKNICSSYNLKAIFVDDGSVDNSLEKLLIYVNNNDSIGLISLSRNFGHQLAVTAGLDMASGDYICIIDADLQDPPERVIEMLAVLKRHEDNVVYAQRRMRHGESFFKKITATLFYRTLKFLTHIDIPADTGDFRLIDKKVLRAILKTRERHRFLRGLIPWLGYKAVSFPYDREERYAGISKYPLRKMFKLAADAIISFSNYPLRLASIAGCITVFIGFIFLVYIFILKLFTDRVIPGLTIILTSMLMIGGFQILLLGLLGEYIGRIFEEVKARPLYLIDFVVGVNKDVE